MNISSHPSTLVIGDIHNRIDAADRAIAKYASRCPRRTVFLGDYFDSFGDGPREMRASCQWLRRSLKVPTRTHLLGNHDLAYLLFQHPQSWCPGWSPKKQQVFDEEMAGIDIGSFRIACQVGPWLLSHAGIHGERLDALGSLGLLGQIEREFASACSGNRSWLFDKGPDRGGLDRHGGMLWLDWNGEFSPTAGFHQVVGHIHPDLCPIESLLGQPSEKGSILLPRRGSHAVREPGRVDLADDENPKKGGRRTARGRSRLR
jgi:hypothetical protein